MARTTRLEKWSKREFREQEIEQLLYGRNWLGINSKIVLLLLWKLYVHSKL